MIDFTEYKGRRFCSFFCLIAVLLISSCSKVVEKGYTEEERAAVDSLINTNPETDSLTVWLDRYMAANNTSGVILVCRELGVRYREMARFTEAIEYHRRGLELAVQIRDTPEVVQAMNNIGTNYRRIGILDEASVSHYGALLLCEQYSDKSSHAARKNRVISLSGIGNVYLMLDNFEIADSIFKVALEEERALGSDVGQAMNYSNRGAVFEAHGMIDSALVCYRMSMKHNSAAGSVVGVSLSHNNIGRLYEKRGQWEDALREYHSAYNLMVENSDLYHWLEACIALARVNLSRGDIVSARRYLKHAEETARKTRSREHLAEICHLNYLYYEKLGDCRLALDNYILSCTYSDSVKNADNQNYIQNQRVNYERTRSERELKSVQKNYETEQRTKNIFLIACLCVLLLAMIAMGFLWYALRMKLHNQRVMKRMEIIRGNFFTNVTHEFRTPLTLILGLSEQMQKEKWIEDEFRTKLATIYRQGKNLLGLVNQLLEVSKVKSGIGDPGWRNGDLVACLRMIVERNQPYTRAKQISLRFISSETEVIMDFVPEYLHKIIGNLLSNAIKFTPKEGQVVVRMVRNGNSVMIRVADTGCGIADSDLPDIFNAFYQGENGVKEAGTGIGLSMVREMVECMDGRICVKSQVGIGSEFIITLPLKHGNASWQQWIAGEETDWELPVPEEEEEEKSLALPSDGPEDRMSASILIVEDNADVSYYIGGLLKDTYRILYARNGAEGLEIAKEHMPELIITDLMMPEMDGYELCRRVRSSDILNHIPIIVVTAKCGGAERVSGLNAGADAYLEKPFSTDELHIRISKLLEQRRLLREKYSKALGDGTTQTVKLSSPDQEFLNRLNDQIYSLMSNHGLNSDMIADKMCMSKSQLNRKVRTITGYNTSAYILQMRLERSKRLLISTEDLIGDIAFRCGFEDANYFARLFKQLFNVTPSQYRKSLNGQK